MRNVQTDRRSCACIVITVQGSLLQALSGCQALAELDAAHNQLAALPKQLCALTNLKTLMLDSNRSVSLVLTSGSVLCFVSLCLFLQFLSPGSRRTRTVGACRRGSTKGCHSSISLCLFAVASSLRMGISKAAV